MQTFLPYPDFIKTAACLDNKRLGKQRVEGLTILKTLMKTSEKDGWKNHPAVKMWKDYEQALCLYTQIICDEWIIRSFKDTILDQLERICPYTTNYNLPWWIGNKDFHLSHQSNLVRKFPEYYREFFPNVPDNLPYLWPVNETKTFRTTK